MMGILDSHIMGRYGLICTPDTNHSEILYIVIVKHCGIKVQCSPPAPLLSKINHDNTCAANLCLLTKA